MDKISVYHDSDCDIHLETYLPNELNVLQIPEM